MDRMFEGLIGNEVEVYVDDVVVKFITAEDHYKALGEFSNGRLKPTRRSPSDHQYEKPTNDQGGATTSREDHNTLVIPISVGGDSTTSNTSNPDEANTRAPPIGVHVSGRGHRKCSNSTRKEGKTTPRILHKQRPLRPAKSAEEVPSRHEDKDLRSRPERSLPGAKTKTCEVGRKDLFQVRRQRPAMLVEEVPSRCED
ncbi:hypothetical protein CR513_58665, partial [Mucuna pruriens]